MPKSRRASDSKADKLARNDYPPLGKHFENHLSITLDLYAMNNKVILKYETIPA
jgi:hypothetical protein